MGTNLIPEIVKKWDVELNEEFKVDIYGDRIFKITESGVWEKKSDDDGYMWEEQLVVLRELMIGDIQIVKLPWKPKKGDVYFTFELLGGKWVVRSFWWGGFPNEYALLDTGWVYRTKEEAEAALPKVATEIGVKYEL